MYDIKIDCPTNEDLKLLSRLNEKGKYLLQDLKKILSYKPKEYKSYTDGRNNGPNNNEKYIMDLYLIIQKYNKTLEKKMSHYEEKKGENRFFTFLYNGMKLFNNNDLKGKEDIHSTNYIMGNLIPKYEKKHISLDSKFLNRNIFSQSGLLPFTQKQIIKFFDEEIQNNGPNSYKSIKSIKFIEKLYDQIERISKRYTIYYNRNNHNLKIKQEEKKEELNNFINQKKEIQNDIEDIKILKELINIANSNYQKIIKELNSSSKKKKLKNKNLNFSKDKYIIKNKNININSKENKDINNQQNIYNNKKTYGNKEINLDEKNKNNNNNKENIEIKQIKKNNFIKIKNRYNRTSSIETFNRFNLLNNRMTESTNFFDFNKTLSKYNIYNNSNNNITLNLNKIKFNNKSDKEILPSFKRNSRNHNNKNLSVLNNNNINNNTIDKIDKKNKTTFNFFYYNKNNGNSSINSNLKSDRINNYNFKTKSFNSLEKKNESNSTQCKPKKKININLTKKNFYQKNEKKLDKVESLLIRKKKIPAIYEELKSCKNLLRISNNSNKNSRLEQIFSELYGKELIKLFNERKAPKELYNSYYNMKESIERCHAPETIFKKYRSNMEESLKKKIAKSNDQDDELKNKYYDFMQMIIKKKLENDEDDLY